MAKATKLPSGSWRCRVYSHTTPDGVKHYESFTAPTKQQAELLAAKFANKADKLRASDITVKEAVENYLRANEEVLSPSTILNYTKDFKRFTQINHIKIRKLTSNDIQSWISELSKTLSPKTVKNTYNLLRVSLSFSGLDCNFVIHLPKAIKKRKFAPENEQIQALYNSAPPKMKIAIALAAYHSLRRGEISALKYGDISGNLLYVHSDVVRGKNGWVYKEIPKTETSNRYVYLTDEELSLIGKGPDDEYIVGLVPSSIGTNFYNIRKRVGLDHIRFHDLRVYFASIAVAMGMSDTTLAHLGGWKEGSAVLKQHYQKPIQSIDEGYARKMNDYFRSMTQDTTQKNKKRPC